MEPPFYPRTHADETRIIASMFLAQRLLSRYSSSDKVPGYGDVPSQSEGFQSARSCPILRGEILGGYGSVVFVCAGGPPGANRHPSAADTRTHFSRRTTR